MAEAHDLFLLGQHPAHALVGGLGAVETLDQLHRRLVSTAVKRAAQGADSAGDGGVEIGQGCGDHPRGEGGGVEFVLGIKDQRDIEHAAMELRRRLVVQQVQEMPGHTVIVGDGVDAHAILVETPPVQQHRRERREQPVSHVELARKIAFGLEVAEQGAAGAQNVHRMGVARDGFQRRLERIGQPAQALEALHVGIELGLRRQAAVMQQVGHFLEPGVLRQVVDVVAPVGEAGAFLADGADRRFAGGDSCQAACFLVLAHCFSPWVAAPSEENSASSLRS